MNRLLLIASVMAISGCSLVLEDRSRCPFYIEIDSDSVSDRTDSLWIWCHDKEDVFLHCRVASGGKTLLRTGRRPMSVSAWGNIGSRTAMTGKNGTDITVTGNGGADRLMHCNVPVDCSKDIERISLEMKNRYIPFHLTIDGIGDGKRLYISITGLNGGFRLDGTATGTAYEILTSVEGDGKGLGEIFLNIPEGNSPEKMEMHISRDDSDCRGIRIRLGRILIDNGFDFLNAGNSGIDIRITLADSGIKISADDWEYTERTDIEM